MYFYGDGFSSATYNGTTARVRAYDLWALQGRRAQANLYKVEKLSKIELNYLWGALNDFDYRYGEVYTILIWPSAFQQLFIYVEIQNDGSIIWYGWRT